MSKHAHESWQIRSSAKGGTYCAACGEHLGEPVKEDVLSSVAALIDEAESRPGSSMYCKVTTYELRKALGQDVTDWPKKSEPEPAPAPWPAGLRKRFIAEGWLKE